jgi:hypothetical protein
MSDLIHLFFAVERWSGDDAMANHPPEIMYEDITKRDH